MASDPFANWGYAWERWRARGRSSGWQNPALYSAEVNMSVQWITYKGKKILYTDHRGLTEAQLIANGEEAIQILEKTPGRFLLLDNFSGTTVGRETLKVFQQWAPRVAPHTEKEAAVITSGLADAILNLYTLTTGRNMRAFPTVEQAKEWLVS
jgi:hypothetical protein